MKANTVVVARDNIMDSSMRNTAGGGLFVRVMAVGVLGSKAPIGDGDG